MILSFHGPYYPYMVTIGRRQFLSLGYDQFSSCHFGLLLLIVNSVMSTLPNFEFKPKW